jgi:acetyltransferase-like isoleucine patch superfamily enzyme
MTRVWRLLASWFRLFGWRRAGVRISPLAYVGADCAFEGPNYIDRLCSIQATRMGRYTYVGNGSTVFGAELGRYCSIGPGVRIGLGIHPVDHVSTSPVFYSHQNVFGAAWAPQDAAVDEFRKVIIGHDVWIGANALVMGGVRIGHGAIIAAGAVVTKDVDPYAIVGGVPAKWIKDRLPRDTARAVEATAWWNLDPAELSDKAGLFGDPNRFLHAATDGT